MNLLVIIIRTLLSNSVKNFCRTLIFIYLKVDVETCKKRIRERIIHPITPDDHYVSEYIFGTYYGGDDGQYISNILEKDYKIEKDRVLVIDNNCSLDIASREIYDFVDFIFPSTVQENITDVALSDSEENQNESEKASFDEFSAQVMRDDERSTQVLMPVGSLANL